MPAPMLPLNHARVILASSSTYRKALLQRIVTNFDCASPEIDESPAPGESPEALADRLALEKAKVIVNKLTASKALATDVAETKPRRKLVIGSDQVAILEGNALQSTQVLGKPGNFANAFKQLSQCSGKTVRFYTACAVIHLASNGTRQRIQTLGDSYSIDFKTLTDRQIEAYLRREEPYDCAGSIKSEALGIALVNRFRGDDPSTLIGLPLIKLIAALEVEGISIV